MANKLKVFRGDDKKFKAVLKVLDEQTGLYQVYAIPTGAAIDVNLPGIPPAGSVVLSTIAPPEVVIVDAPNGVISCVIPKTKSVLMNLGDNQAIDAIITETSGDVTTAEKVKVLLVVDRKNP